MAEKSKVTRIKADDSAPKEPKATTKAQATKVKSAKVKAVKVAKRTKKTKSADKPLSKHWYIRFFQKIGRYFKGSWEELKLVRWPTRQATWGLTGAVLIFSAFFVGLITLLDLGFNSLFELIITK